MTTCTTPSLQDLTGPQQTVAEQLITLIRAFYRATADHLQHNHHTAEEKYATFGLFGARGSGKSTVLDCILSRLAEPEAGQRNAPGPLLVCRKPLDCTTLADHLPLGLSLIAHAKRFIDMELKERYPSRRGSAPVDDEPFREAYEKAWNELKEAYVGTDPEHRQLQLSLAVTQSEYKTIAAGELDSRAELAGQVKKWVASALAFFSQRTGSTVTHLLIALEDADLGTGPLALRTIATFLDELADERLLFIVVADEQNLEERCFSSTEEVPREMVPQILAKVIPIHHRVYLDPWNDHDVLDFIPFAEHIPAAATQNSEPQKPRKLRALLNEALDKRKELALGLRDLVFLLPRYPRGLTDLYRGLQLAETENLLPMLARARGDLALARKLPTRSLRWWGLQLQWSATASKEDWRPLADPAVAGQPLWALAAAVLPFSVTDDEDAALWAELMLNISLRGQNETMAYLLQRLPPLTTQIAKQSFPFKPTPHELFRLGQQETALFDSPWLRWHGQDRESAELEAGWAPLVDWSIGRQRSTWNAILRDLGAPLPLSPAVKKREDAIRESLGAVPEKKNHSTILPADIRSLILLTDRMGQIPWDKILAWAEAPLLASWPALLALFCVDAYLSTLLDAINRETSTAQDDQSKAGKILAMVQAEAAELAKKALDRQTKETPAEQLARLCKQAEAIPWTELSHPLARATQAFLGSPAITDLLPKAKGS